MKHYTHLTQQQRYQISALLKTAISHNEVARIVGVDKSTISRELKRNTGQRGYRPNQAHRLCQEGTVGKYKKKYCFSFFIGLSDAYLILSINWG